MMTGFIQDQHLEKQIEKQIGCMSGFFQIFDRQQVLAGKRIYSTKRLPPSPTGVSSSPESVKSVESPAISRELEKPEVVKPAVVIAASPDRHQTSPAANANGVPISTPPKSPLPLPMFELKEGTPKSSWKFCKEMPRLSLDSRATVDSKGSLMPREIRTDNSVLSGNRTNNTSERDDRQRSSPSVIARLMGLEPLPSSDSSESPGAVKNPELRRSASERVSRDLFHSRFIDGNNFQVKLPNQTSKQSVETNLPNNNVIRENVSNASNRKASNGRANEMAMDYSSRNLKAESHRTSPWRSPQQRRSFYDSADFFPETKQTTGAMYGDIEKKLKMRGIEEQSNDLETLKQILEALQLKGLLHSTRPSNRDNQRNFVYDRNFASDESKIVLMKPWRSPASNVNHRTGGVRRSPGESLLPISPRRERGAIDRNARSPVRARNSSSPNRIESNLKSCNSIVKRKPLTIETQRRVNETSESRRSSPINSPKLTPKKPGSDYQSITNRSPRNRMIYSKEKAVKNNVTEDESSSISESTVSSSSQTDTERTKMEDYGEGRSLLERCDKLLSSIAEMNSSTESLPSSASVIPSPVSVLDSTFDKDESSSPSPVMKRNIDFKDPAADFEDDLWSPTTSPVKSTNNEEFISNDPDFVYISEVLRASRYLPEDSGVFFLLEKQQYLNGKDASKVSKLQRKLVFDIVNEILDRNRRLPPWKIMSFTDSVDAKPSLKQIWSEFLKIRKRDSADDLLELICGVLRKDLAGTNGWVDQTVEMSEAVLDIERLIFKDLVSETIRDLADFAGKTTFLAPRRKLVF